MFQCSNFLKIKETLKNAKNFVDFTKIHSPYEEYGSLEFWLIASFFAIFEGFQTPRCFFQFCALFMTFLHLSVFP